MVQPRNKFVLDDAAIEQALALVPAAPIPEQMDVALQLSQCGDKLAIDEEFVCSICHNVAWKAEECA